MNPLAQLLLAACVLHVACAAAAPHDIILDKEAAVASQSADIPVAVVLDDSQPSIKINEINNEETQRPALDLRNPGPPQRQEHETQNPEAYSEAQQKACSVRDSILQTQELLRRGFASVNDDIHQWLSNNQQIDAIQQNIQSLRDTFTGQIQKLNASVQALAPPPEDSPQHARIKSDFEKVETRLKTLESNFNKGVRALSDGVNFVGYLRADGAQPAAPVPAPAPAPAPTTTNPLFQLMTAVQTNVADSIRNMTTAMSQLWSPNQGSAPAGTVQADDASSSAPAQGNPWQNLLAPFNIFNQGQGQQTPSVSAQPSGPFYQTFLSGFFNRPGASQPSQPAVGQSAATATVVSPNNPVKDEKQPEPAAVLAVEPAPAPPTTAAPLGPIRQILNNNPVVQSIAGAVQRIQTSINNPEKPRDTVKPEDVASKGGFYGRPPRPGGSGDNNDSGLKQQSGNVNEDSIKEDKPADSGKKEVKPEVVLDKTE